MDGTLARLPGCGAKGGAAAPVAAAPSIESIYSITRSVFRVTGVVMLWRFGAVAQAIS